LNQLSTNQTSFASAVATQETEFFKENYKNVHNNLNSKVQKLEIYLKTKKDEIIDDISERFDNLL
jgi:hypothetical protein